MRVYLHIYHKYTLLRKWVYIGCRRRDGCRRWRPYKEARQTKLGESWVWIKIFYVRSDERIVFRSAARPCEIFGHGWHCSTIVVAKSSGLTFVNYNYYNYLSGASIGEVLVAVVLATVVCAQPLFRNFSLPFEAASEVRMQQPRQQDTPFDCVWLCFDVFMQTRCRAAPPPPPFCVTAS